MESLCTSDGRLPRCMGAVVFLGYAQLPQYAKLLLDEEHQDADADAASNFGDQSVCGSMGKHKVILIACASSELHYGPLVDMLLDLKEKMAIGFMLFVGRYVGPAHETDGLHSESAEQLRIVEKMPDVDQAIAYREDGPQLHSAQSQREGHLQSLRCGPHVRKHLFTDYAWSRIVALERSWSEAIQQDDRSLGLTMVLLEVDGSLRELSSSIMSGLSNNVSQPSPKLLRPLNANAATACVTRLLTIAPGRTRPKSTVTPLQADHIDSGLTDSKFPHSSTSDDHVGERVAAKSAELNQVNPTQKVLEGRRKSTDTVKSVQPVILRPTDTLTTRLPAAWRSEALSSRDSHNSTEIRRDSRRSVATTVRSEAVSVSHTYTLGQYYRENHVTDQARAHFGNVNHYHQARPPSLSDTASKWAPTAISGLIAGYDYYSTKQTTQSSTRDHARAHEVTRCEKSKTQAVTSNSISMRKITRYITTDASQKKSSSSEPESHQITTKDRAAHGMLAYLNSRASQTALQLARQREQEFFSCGRVFATHLDPEKDFNRVRHVEYGLEGCLEPFVVVRANAKDACGQEDKNHCYALPISTYEGQGVGGPGVIKAEHGVIQPMFFRDNTNMPCIDIGEDEHPEQYERGMCSMPIKIRITDEWEPADNMLKTRSRVNYGQIFRICKDEPVLSIGEVHAESLQWLVAQFNDVQKQQGTVHKREINYDSDQSDGSDLNEEDESADETESSLQEGYRESAVQTANTFRRLRMTYVEASDDQLLSFMARQLCRSQSSFSQRQAYDRIRKQIEFVNDSARTRAR